MQFDELDVQIFAKHHASIDFVGLHYLPYGISGEEVRREWSVCSSPVVEWLALLAPLFMFRRLQKLHKYLVWKAKILR